MRNRTRPTTRLCECLLGLALAPSLAGADSAESRWRLRFFHDVDGESLVITDLRFASGQRGVGSAVLRKGQRLSGAVLLSADAGRTWRLQPVKPLGQSLFFVNDSLGWIAAEDGIWQTSEAGRDWTRIHAIKGVSRLYFIDGRNGFAIGAPKAIWRTTDGGRNWTRVPAAMQLPGNPDYTVYEAIAFATPKVGMIAGSYRPPRRTRRPEFPDWMDPEAAAKRREWPTSTLLLQTRDGGETWTPSVSSTFGRVRKLLLSPSGFGLALFSYENSFEVPSEVYELNLRDGGSKSVFRRKDRHVTDLLLWDGWVYLGAVERTGSLAHLPIPGRVSILRSKDLLNWHEMAVDYRAEANRVVLSGSPDGVLCAATDSGMVLTWEPPVAAAPPAQSPR